MTLASTPSTGSDASLLGSAWSPVTDARPRVEDSQASQSLAVVRGGQEPVSNPGGQATTAVASNGSGSQGTSGSALAGQSSDWVNQFQSWSALADAQAALTDSQLGEAALLSTYRQLLQTSQQLSQASTQMTALSQQLQQLDQQISAQGSLSAQLQPTVMGGEAGRRGYVLDKVDLLSARPSDEQMRIYFPASRSGVSVSLPADSAGQTVAETLNSALQKEGIRVDLSGQGQLRFSATGADERKLSQPILMTGQGIRVPAGNAVSVSLRAEPSALGQLAQTLAGGDNGQRQAAQQQVNGLLAQIQQTLTALRGYRQNLLQQVQSLSAQQLAGSEQAGALVGSLGQALGQGSYQQVATSLQAQANLSSQAVVALLTQE